MELSSTWQQMEANKATKDIFMIPAPVMTNGLHFPAYRLNLLTAPKGRCQKPQARKLSVGGVPPPRGLHGREFSEKLAEKS